MMPDDQVSLRKCLSMQPILDELLDLAPANAAEEWFQKNCKLFLEVCEAHGRTASQHQNMLVRKFIQKPSDGVDERHLKQITASGPPLPSLMDSLERLRDLRMATRRDDIETAHEKLNSLRALIRS